MATKAKSPTVQWGFFRYTIRMFQHASNKTRGILALIFLSVVYAGTGVVTRYLSFYFTLFQQIYIRTFLAFILGMVFFRKSLNWNKLRKVSTQEWLLIIARTAATFVFGATLWAKATTITKLANVTFIDSLPITATLSFLFLWEKVTVKKVFYLMLSFVGVIILSVKDYSQILTVGFGELLVFISGFFFAFRNISRRWHTNLLNDQEITQLMFAFGSVMLFLLSFLFKETITFSRLSPELLFMIFLGGCIMIASIFLTNYGFANVSPVLGNNILNLEAAFGILFGYLFYREISTIMELVGGVIIIISVIKMNQLDKSEKK